jgi:hypothetical protein
VSRFEDIPQYGWPLSTIWQTNPRQFATEETAMLMQARIEAVLGPEFNVKLTSDNVGVGPFRRVPMRMLRITVIGAGQPLIVNAGLEAYHYDVFGYTVWRDMLIASSLELRAITNPGGAA